MKTWQQQHNVWRGVTNMQAWPWHRGYDYDYDRPRVGVGLDVGGVGVSVGNTGPGYSDEPVVVERPVYRGYYGYGPGYYGPRRTWRGWWR